MRKTDKGRKNMNLSVGTFRKLEAIRSGKEKEVGFRLSWDAFFMLGISGDAFLKRSK